MFLQSRAGKKLIVFVSDALNTAFLNECILFEELLLK